MRAKGNGSVLVDKAISSSGYCFSLSYLQASNAAKGPDRSVHFEIFSFTSVFNARVIDSSSDDRAVSYLPPAGILIHYMDLSGL